MQWYGNEPTVENVTLHLVNSPVPQKRFRAIAGHSMRVVATGEHDGITRRRRSGISGKRDALGRDEIGGAGRRNRDGQRQRQPSPEEAREWDQNSFSYP
jgi:hypothetical protein